ncbi:MAG: hypothetical protein CFH39_02454 [Alphaproteobacteria bacterium MarineAlpha10_Bin2]|nr:MAG: hypothetical protein CFH39_02454 [Alphaproteobacteria bacterium MarineAlpha10_Bin2]
MPRRLAVLLGGLILLLGASAQAETVFREVTGRFTLEGRYFPHSSILDGQREHSLSLVAEPEAYLENEAGQGLVLKPFLRWDSADARRTHWDIREAYGLFFGEFEDSEWELRAGIDKVFWGVAESRHLVDVINQTDLVESPDQEEKLGQPMVHATWLNDLGAFEAFALPYFRKRTFQGRAGRLRTALHIDGEQTSYESAAKQHHLDVAARYSNSVGALDFGLAVFDGTNRSPNFSLGVDGNGSLVLVPSYEQMRQVSLDAQVTTGAWLLKFESYWRDGERDAAELETDYLALIGGFEYTLYGIFGGDADLGLLTEFLYDGRDERATVVTEEDVFAAIRLAFNDEASTDILFGVMQDLDKPTRTLFLEANRRLDDNFSLGLEGTAFLNVDDADGQLSLRRDSFLQLDLTYHY